jgi:uncharacterized membrane protein
MPTVTSEITIDADVDKVYAIARDIERFPEFMEDVESVEILEQTPERQISRWSSIIREFGRKIAWVEEDHWDDAAKTCTWQQTEGDFTRYEGTWEFTPTTAGATLAKLQIDYEFNVPLLGALIQGIVKKKMQDNTEAMLAAIKAKAEEC